MKGGVKKIWCLKCKEDVNYGGWSDHCLRRHPVQGPDAEERSKDDDDNKRKDDDTDQPKGSDAGHLCAGVGDAVSTQKKPKDGYRKKEAKETAPGRRKKGLFRRSGDTETEEGKSSTQRKVKPG